MAPHKDFAFVGRLCLDLAQTGDMGWGERYERLTSPSELVRWMAVSPLGLANMRVTNDDLEAAKTLRGAIWRIASAVLDHSTPRAVDVRQLNADARRPSLHRVLDGDARSMHWDRPNVSAALATIAQDAVVLFGDASQRGRLRRCENSECRVVFYDDSRPGSRRWCFPNRCGDRIRARVYRQRNA